eukprot:CAMPEP_0172589604 /NCGR_PEP_ID=MMETSP1068-20121228/8267_1 /TAXON_ID=35684 /ORGANISM="Pseudopedinella elastica, Strain CCMP716" /LENGTH=190 /DNA_ID=CAMNT_0013385229 /DNA_START=101 /DNA_END=670 /DNA_ORIENTATION=+
MPNRYLAAGAALAFGLAIFVQMRRDDVPPPPPRGAKDAHSESDDEKEEGEEDNADFSGREFDRAGLPNRVLRKAETVIQGRTSRVLCVVERCTDDHNYSAIIRTCEALGIQHIWLVDPPLKPHLLTDEKFDKDGESGARGPSGDEPERRQGDGGRSKRRFEHGMYARKATEWVTLREFETTADCIAALRA